MGTGVLFREQSGWGVWLTTHLQLASWNGAMPLLHVFLHGVETDNCTSFVLLCNNIEEDWRKEIKKYLKKNRSQHRSKKVFLVYRSTYNTNCKSFLQHDLIELYANISIVVKCQMTSYRNTDKEILGICFCSVSFLNAVKTIIYFTFWRLFTCDLTRVGKIAVAQGS
jgi:hypothetical protein